MRFISLLIAAGLLLISTEALSQAKKIEFSVMIGHQFGAVVDETTKDEGVDSLGLALGALGSASYELILDYHITPKMYLELSWDHQPTKLEFIDRPADTTSILTDLSVNYYQVGLIYNWSDSEKQPFIGMTVGMAQWITGGDWQNESGFVFTPIFGYQGWVSDYFAFRAQLKFMISNMPAGTIFTNTSTGTGFDHTKNTWATQVVLAVGFTLGK
jgi:hypothetical protein